MINGRKGKLLMKKSINIAPRSYDEEGDVEWHENPEFNDGKFSKM